MCHRDQAQQIHDKLLEQIETLKLIVRQMKNRPDQVPHERARANTVAVAIDYLPQAINVIALVSSE